MKRRSALPLLLGLGVVAAGARGQQRRPGDLALAVGIEGWLVDCGFARALARRFAVDTGLSLRLEAGTSSALLPALARGEMDLALTQAPTLAAELEAQGRIHDAHDIADSDFVLVGPAGSAARTAVEHDALRALAAIAEQGTAFLTRNDGSGGHLAEQALWRAAGIAPTAPWYRPMDPAGGPLLVQAREARACCLVDRAGWLAAGGRGLALRADSDRLLATRVRVHRSLVATHHAARLFVAWLTGRTGRALVARTPGLRAPARAA